MKAIFSEYINFFEKLSPENAGDLKNFVTEDFHFVDPFNDVRGASKSIEIFNNMYKKLGNCRFEIFSCYEDQNRLIVEWGFHFKYFLINRGKDCVIRGFSVVESDAESLKIAKHTDYWDSATQLYAKVPVLKYFIKFLQSMAG